MSAVTSDPSRADFAQFIHTEGVAFVELQGQQIIRSVTRQIVLSGLDQTRQYTGFCILPDQPGIHSLCISLLYRFGNRRSYGSVPTPCPCLRILCQRVWPVVPAALGYFAYKFIKIHLTLHGTSDDRWCHFTALGSRRPWSGVGSPRAEGRKTAP